MSSNLSKAIQTTKAAAKIITKARNEMIKTSFDTTKTIASMYKEAGFDAFKYGKKLLTETLKLTVDNQKNLVKTSNQALKDAVETIREQKRVESKKKTAKKKKAEMSIDDLMSA